MPVSTRKRIINTGIPAYITPIPVTLDWSSASNAALDIHASTNIPLVGVPYTALKDLHLQLWEGQGDDDDFACLKVQASTGAASYEDLMGLSSPFSSFPAVNSVAYILSIWINA